MTWAINCDIKEIYVFVTHLQGISWSRTQQAKAACDRRKMEEDEGETEETIKKQVRICMRSLEEKIFRIEIR